jgi:hypothetical protein
MNIIKEELEKNIKENVPSFNFLNNIEANKFTTEIVKKFCITSQYKFPLWENLKDKWSINNPDGWKFIVDYPTMENVYLFLEPLDNKVVYILPDMVSVKQIIAESFGFVFYLTNANNSYLICFNDHDYLIAAGDALNWLKHIKIHFP